MSLRPEPGPAHPVRQQHAEPGPGQHRRACRRKPNARLGVQGDLGRRGGAQRPVQLREEPAARPSPASSSSSGCLIPAARPAVEAPAQTSAADIIRLGSSVDCSANSTRQSPGLSSGVPGRCRLACADVLGPAPSPSPPASPRSGSISRKQVRTGPAGRCAAGCQASSRGGQLRCLLLVFRCGDLDLGAGRGERRDPALGHRDAGRLAPAAGGKQRLRGEPGPGGGVGEGVQRVGQDQGRRPIAGARPRGTARASRRRARARVRRRHPDSTGRHRAAYPPSSARSAGQHPTAGRKVSRQPRHRGQVTHAAAGHLTRERAGLAERGAAGQRLRRARRPARGPARRPAMPGARPGGAGRRSVPTGRADQLRRRERPVRAGWQPQGQLVVDRLAGQVAGRAGQLGERSREPRHVRGERMRPGRTGRRPCRGGAAGQRGILGPQTGCS